MDKKYTTLCLTVNMEHLSAVFLDKVQEPQKIKVIRFPEAIDRELQHYAEGGWKVHSWNWIELGEDRCMLFLMESID